MCDMLPSFGCRGTRAYLATRKLTGLQNKRQLRHYWVQSRLLEYPGVWRERQLRTGLRNNITMPGETCQDTDMVSFL
jgi:hypothetical protein